ADEESAAAAQAPARRARRAKPGRSAEMIGSSPEIGRIRTLIEKVAPCDARVLITGE
ncbi:MAG TPA: response regulator, partial [Alistipes sp.]|nr:response regulator [Alistipes sp.]